MVHSKIYGARNISIQNNFIANHRIPSPLTLAENVLPNNVDY